MRLWTKLNRPGNGGHSRGTPVVLRAGPIHSPSTTAIAQRSRDRRTTRAEAVQNCPCRPPKPSSANAAGCDLNRALNRIDA